MRARMSELTGAERKVATALLADYPFAGLLTLAELAERSSTSSQTVLRLVAKLAFRGYGEFQRTLIGEIKEGYRSPITLHEATAPDSSGVRLHELTQATVDAVHDTMASTPEQQFEAVCDLLGDRQRAVYLIGGRMTHTIAMFLSRHLRQIRPKVHLIAEYEEEWPEYLLRMGRKDLLLVFDCRRYQPSLEQLARLASRERGAQVVLFTDRWLSPVSKYSAHTLPSAVDVGTPWDTSLPMLLIAEAIINVLAERDWGETSARIKLWDELRASGETAAKRTGSS